jgi:multiple sugar transport system ATP-binding protein
MTMGDRIMVMRDGKVQQIGEPETLYNHPANIFVGGFIGSPAMNVFPGRLEASPEGVDLVSDMGRFSLPPQMTARILPAEPPSPGGNGGAGPREVMWGIRAEDVTLSSVKPDTPQAVVDLVEGLGADAQVTLTLGKHILVMRTPSDLRPNENETVGLNLNLNKLHLFDPESEASILRQG